MSKAIRITLTISLPDDRFEHAVKMAALKVPLDAFHAALKEAGINPQVGIEDVRTRAKAPDAPAKPAPDRVAAE